MSKLYCDDCTTEFELDDVGIQTMRDTVGKKRKQIAVEITYFECPNCQKRYTILISDSEVRSLIACRVKLMEKKEANIPDIPDHVKELNKVKKLIEAKKNMLKHKYYKSKGVEV